MRVWIFLTLGLVTTAKSAPVPTGYPNKGTLVSAQNLHRLIRENPTILESRSPEEFQFGTAQMAEALLSIGRWGAGITHEPVWIGDISKVGGGPLARHLTHQRGLDADIAYLVRAHRVSGHRAERFHDRFTEQFGIRGKFSGNFLLDANYRLLERVVRELPVQEVFVGCGIYDALEKLDHTRPASIMERIYALKGHEDHFHIRLKCPADTANCSDAWFEDPSPSAAHSKKKKSTRVKVNGKWRDCGPLG